MKRVIPIRDVYCNAHQRERGHVITRSPVPHARDVRSSVLAR